MNYKRMTALAHYSNGSIGWPEGMSANWPVGEERIVPDNIWEAVMRDGAGTFKVAHYLPAVELIDRPATVAPEQVEPEPVVAPNKRAAALAKARAAKAAKKAAAQADKD